MFRRLRCVMRLAHRRASLRSSCNISVGTMRRCFSDISRESPIYVLGVGNLGKFVAHALKKHHPWLHISLLLHRSGLLSEWEAAGRAIECVTDGISDKRTGFDVELLSFSAGENDVQMPNTPIKHLIVATKAYMATSAVSLVKHRLRSTSSILFLQNGMGNIPLCSWCNCLTEYRYYG